MNGDSAFVDTNVLVYAVDRDARAKQKRAQLLLTELGAAIVVSTQVLQEFYVTVTVKLKTPLSSDEAERRTHDLSELDVVTIDVPLVAKAIATSRADHLSLWDALIVEAARVRGCRRPPQRGSSGRQDLRHRSCRKPVPLRAAYSDRLAMIH